MGKKKTRISEQEAMKTVTRLVAEGDIKGGETPSEARAETVKKRIRAKINQEATALNDIMANAPDDKRLIAESYLRSFPFPLDCGEVEL